MKLTYEELLAILTEELEHLTDPRSGQNTRYDVTDAALASFAVFFTQTASFLAYQRKMEDEKGRNNAHSIFGIKHIPSDTQIRRILDGVAAAELESIFRRVLARSEEEGILESYRGDGERLMIILDGTGYYTSRKVRCEHCSVREDDKGPLYLHSVITPIIAKPGEARVLALPPEYIEPQDGEEKQDCERNAAKRWLSKNGSAYGQKKSVIVADDLYCNQPFCEQLEDKGLDYILVCKEESHPMLYETLAVLAKNDGIEEVRTRKWNGRFGEIITHRYVEQLPLRGGKSALQVNWCEVCIVHEDTDQILYRNSFATNLPIDAESVSMIAEIGRNRWKVENENINVLKTKGYHLEHNFGHGKQTLSAVLLSLNLQAFLFHTLLEISDLQYASLREKLAVRKTFFRDIEALTRYMFFDSWDGLLLFMLKGLDLAPT